MTIMHRGPTSGICLRSMPLYREHKGEQHDLHDSHHRRDSHDDPSGRHERASEDSSSRRRLNGAIGIGKVVVEMPVPEVSQDEEEDTQSRVKHTNCDECEGGIFFRCGI
jgi:hypothetical protein